MRIDKAIGQRSKQMTQRDVQMILTKGPGGFLVRN
jgi:hypothetical protein